MDNSNKKILIVEDDQFLREFYQELLQAEGYSTDTAVDGEEGLRKVISGGYDLVLLDIILPKIDGMQILREAHEHSPKAPNGPVVVLTNLGQDAIIKECFNLGVEGFLIKSALNPDQILTEIKAFLNKTSNG